MSWLRWLTANVADTEAGTHADLRPVRVAGTAGSVGAHLRSKLAGLPHWAVLPDSTDAELRLTRRTRLMGYVDDVRVRLTGDGDGVVVQVRSQSRVGKGDLGQNRRNVIELLGLLPGAGHETA